MGHTQCGHGAPYHKDAQSYYGIPPAFFEKGATRESLVPHGHTSDMTTILL